MARVLLGSFSSEFAVHHQTCRKRILARVTGFLFLRRRRFQRRRGPVGQTDQWRCTAHEIDTFQRFEDTGLPARSPGLEINVTIDPLENPFRPQRLQTAIERFTKATKVLIIGVTQRQHRIIQTGELLDEYLKVIGLGAEPGSPLFPAAIGKTGKLSRRPLVRTDAAEMLKRRLKQAGLPAHYSPHSFRATASRIFWKMTALLKPLSESPATLTAGRRNSMTDAVRRCSWRIWKGFATKG